MRFQLEYFSRRPRVGNDQYSDRPGLLTRFLRNEEGSMIVYMTIAVPVLIGIAALAAEGGFWLYQKRMLQGAADNAAYSAAAAYAADKTADYTSQARAITANDYNLVNGQNNVTVAVNKPPTGNCHTGTSNYTGANAIEVVVTKPQPPRLAGIWLSGNVNICGRGVAIVPGTGDCILALGANGGAAITTMDKVNNLNVNLTGCSLFSDSTASNSIQMNGNNNVLNADAIGSAGGILMNGNSKSSIFNSSTGNPQVADPYASDAASTWVASQSAPATPALPSSTCASGCTVAGSITPSSGCTPGGSGIKTVTLGPGLWTSATLTGSGSNQVNISKCTTAVNLSGGNYSFPQGLSLPNGATLNIQAASTIVVATGGISSGAVTFGSGNYSIYIAGANWSTTSGITFGSGNYTIQVTKVAGTGGNWTLGGNSVFGTVGSTGTYNVTLDGLLTMNGSTTNFGGGNVLLKTGAGWTIGNAITFGNGNFNVTLGGPWTISQNATFGNGNYTFAVTGDFTTNGNLTMGSGTYSGSMVNWYINGTTTTIGAGIYYLSGNFNINANGGNATVTANHVTLVLTGATSIVDFSENNSTFTITAPTSGWNSGIAIWEPNSTGINHLATGNSSIINVTGVIYAPHADVQYVGNTGATTTCTQIISDKVEFGGNSINITGDCTSVPGVKTFGQVAALVE